jgi:hypothetical protein
VVSATLSLLVGFQSKRETFIFSGRSVIDGGLMLGVTNRLSNNYVDQKFFDRMTLYTE